jgi:O-antigen biosynthesis protein WbqV
MNRQGFKKSLIVVHDLVMTGVAVLATFYVRFEGPSLDERLVHLPLFLPPFVTFAGVVYWFSHLYRSKWRFASLPDLFNIFRAATILAVALLVIDYILVSPQLRGTFFFGKITIALYWLIQMFLLGGPRLAFRYMKYARSRHTLQRDASTPTLLLGRGGDVEVILRAIEAGTVKKTRPLGILSWRTDDLSTSAARPSAACWRRRAP